MKRTFIFLLSIFLTLSSLAQIPYQYIGVNNNRVIARGQFKADSALILPGVSVVNYKAPGMLRYDASDSSVYVYSGFNWIKVGPGAGGSSYSFTYPLQLNTGIVSLDTTKWHSFPFYNTQYRPITWVPTLQEAVSQGNTLTDSRIDMFVDAGEDYLLFKKSNGDIIGKVTNTSDDVSFMSFSFFPNIYTSYRHGQILVRYGSDVQAISLPDRSGTFILDADTSSMLSPYLRSNVAAATYQPIGSYLTSVPTLQEVTDAGNTTNNDITIGNLFLNGDAISAIGGSLNLVLGNSSFIIKSDTDIVQNSPILRFKHTAQRSFTLPNKSGTIILDTDTSSMLSPYLPSNVAAATYQPIGSYLTTGTLTDSLNTNGVTAITLNTPNVIFSTPVTFSKTGRSWSGTLSLNTQSANTILAGPTTGSAAAPTFRALVDADIPSASKGVQWTGVDSSFAYDQVRTGYHESIRFITQPYQSNIRPWGNVVNGIGAITQGTEYVVLSTSTLSNNGAGINPATTFNSTPSAATIAFGNYLSSDYSVYTIQVRIPTLNDGTERFLFSCGLLSNSSPGAAVDGAAVYYDLSGSSTGSTAAAYWQTMTASSSSRTWNQNHTQVTVQANTWVTIKIAVNTSQALFYVGNTLIATHTTNIPSSSVAVSPFARIAKTNGTTARTSEIRFITLDKKYSTPL